MLDGLAPKGPNRKGLANFRKPLKHEVWICRVCKFSNNANSVAENCRNCGRDYWGVPGRIPS